MTPEHYALFYGDKEAWKNDMYLEREGREPTISTIVWTHQDLSFNIPPTDSFRCFVVHVRGFHGRGFMPAVRGNHSSGSIINGDVITGTSRTKLEQAAVLAKRMMEMRQLELNESMEKHRREAAASKDPGTIAGKI